jgi:hypothetical protein
MLLTTTAITITTIVPTVYAEDNKVKAEDDSIAQATDCDDNELDGNANVNGDFCSNFARATTIGTYPPSGNKLWESQPFFATLLLHTFYHFKVLQVSLHV